jgi:two-component system, chemotaxis family, CheB/CheR fusion protein
MSQESQTKESTPSANHFLVVGIGASAGGLDAFKQLIRTIPVDSGMAYILVQHLDPTHNSILCELIQKITLIPTYEVTDNLKVQPNHIYVIPSNKLLTVKDDLIHLADRELGSYNLPIDLFFKSLAEVYQSRAIGIVLSGTGKDGTVGLRTLKLHGGITFAQDNSAAFNEMPQHAIDAKVVDFVLSPGEIVSQLMELVSILKENTSLEKVIEPRPEDIYFKQILALLDLQKGVDFTYYKQTTIRRRITRRMMLRNLAQVRDYLENLKVNPAEVDVLFQDILIPVTEFFRDAPAFDNLCSVTLPALLKEKTIKETFRAWCIGCSTGQEAYSLAICLFEFFSSQSDPCKIQVFATDISEAGIAHARSGFYSFADVSTVSPERLAKFFTKTEGGFVVNKAIRDICVFATHNVLTNPPFAGIDLISCRNVLIYMDPFLQRKAMATFHYSLNAKGMLLLGKSESVGNSSDLFGSFNETDKMYSRNSVPGRFINIVAKRRIEFFANGNNKQKDIRPNDDYQKSADDIVLAKSPAGVIVNDHFEILQFRGATGEWLESAPGKPNVNVLKMAKYGLAVDLRNALHKAKTSKLPFIKEGIILEKNGIKKIATLEVYPILNTINLYFLILFKNTAVLPTLNQPMEIVGKGKISIQEIRTLELEKELSQTREDMRTITEDQEAGNEELLSANEELLSGSEELRSLNEELEISKEELQSTVEELSVANQELTFRNDELTYSRKYSEGIISTISEPLIVLNKDLQIKSVNSAFYKFFNLNEKETIGSHFYEIDQQQWSNPAIRAMLQQTLQEQGFNMHYELKMNFKRIGERVLVLNARKIVNESNSEQLILLIIEDITDQKLREELTESKSEYSKTILDANPIITSTSSPDGMLTYANKYFLTYSGLSLEEATRQGWAAVIHPDQTGEVTKAWMECMASGEEFFKEVLLKRHDGAYRWHASHALPIRNPEGTITSWVSSSSYIHDQKMFSDELETQIRERTQSLKESNIELMHSNKNLEQFAFIASHDLQEPLRKIKTFSNILIENYQEVLNTDGKELVKRIFTASERLSRLIQDVLNFSRIDHTEFAYVTTDINKILANVINDFALLIDEKEAIIKVDVMPEIKAIPVQINQLFYNLLSNSLKFCQPENKPVITVTSRNLTKVELLKHPDLNHELAYFEILFADNGIGFNEQYKEKIFEIFQRLHNQRTYTGTGIGLALCKKIVLNHSGLIYAESHEKAGTLFHIILPLNGHPMHGELLPGYAE